ncbi:hypothetical protein F7725_005799 [Dissostichus mawsoni]|uniref:Uncharacterized protein n=1 Tax=Dissostichus mawsoni TaxID=36200 RepID=A0A7J5YSA8_DISMA|nr:hypothetical protein F7725_005799 [Dissostichus mawsoni]
MTALIESGPAKNKKSMMDGFRDKEGKGGEKEERSGATPNEHCWYEVCFSQGNIWSNWTVLCRTYGFSCLVENRCSFFQVALSAITHRCEHDTPKVSP